MPSSVADGWDRVAAEYEARVQPLTAAFVAPLLDALDRALGDVDLVDVACGTGAVSLEAASRGARVMACDYSAEMVRITAARAAERGLEHVTTLICSGESLPEEWSGRYDCAISSFGVIFFEDARKGMSELARTLKPGGRLAISAWGSMDETPAFGMIPSAAAALARARGQQANPALLEASHPPRRKTPQEVEHSLRALGLQQVHIHGPFSSHLTTPNAEAYWQRFALGAPGTRSLLAVLQARDADALRANVIASLSQRFGGEDAPVDLEARAYVVTAVQPP